MESPDRVFIRKLQLNANEIERYRILLTKCMNRISTLEIQKNQILANYIEARNLQQQNSNQCLLGKSDQVLDSFRQNSDSTESFSTMHQILTSLPSSKGCQFQSSPGSISNASISVNKDESSSGASIGRNERKNTIEVNVEMKQEVMHFSNLKSDESGLNSHCCTSSSSRTRTPCQLSANLPKLSDFDFTSQDPQNQLTNVQNNVLSKLLHAATNQRKSRPNHLDLDNGPHQSKVPRLSSLNIPYTNHNDSLHQPLSKRSIFQYNKQIRKIDPKNRSEAQVKQEVELYMQKNATSNVYNCTFPECNNNDGKGFSLKLRCKTHIEGEHLQIRYQCPYCSFQTARDDNLPKHIDKKHRGLLELAQGQQQAVGHY